MLVATLLVSQEFGDKSQLAAIALGSTYNTWSVILGGSLGFVLCIILAISLGNILKKYVKPHVISICGGLLFIGFGTYWLVTIIY